MTKMTFLLFLHLLLFISYSSSRRILHQPFFPTTDPSPPPPPLPPITTQPPSLSPSPQPKHPFSSLTPPTTTHHHLHFFPFYTTPPTTTTVPSTSLPTFPANISSVILPPPSSKSHVSKKLLFLSLTLSLLSILFIATIVATLLYHRTNSNNHHKPPKSDNLRLFPANFPTSDKPPPTLSPNFSTPSSEFLYLGTLISPLHDQQHLLKTSTNVYPGSVAAASTSAGYDMMGSPELHPLPPLPRQDFRHQNNMDEDGFTDSEVEGNEQYFSPNGSPVVLHRHKTVPPPAPPMPQRGLLETERKGDEVLKPKLKGLHWDKLVKSSSEKAMVWDHLKFSSFKLDEEKIETLFMANSSNVAPNHSPNQPTVHPMTVDMSRKTRVLDSHKSRNIAILLRAFNLSIDEVCECILQGNVDSLGSELLGSLLKMAPTMEEEVRLKEFDDASLLELDNAEKFLKAVVGIPFAFKRVDAMLYVSNFDSEAEYLKGSFETIKSACGQLRTNKMFIKLLEAVLVTGNRMNIGTTRGDAYAFKLDTLLKLIDIKGTDGKTTLLHFVVREITRSEGRVSYTNQQSELCDEVESTKRGLELVSCLGSELVSVKKAATMDFDLLSKEVRRLAVGLTTVREVVRLNERYGSDKRFSDSMNVFLKKAGDDMVRIEGEERVSVNKVEEITEYFHGNSNMEEGQRLRIFVVVRDFLLVLDRVCKEVGKINERTTVGSRTLPSVFCRFRGPLDFGSFDGEDDSNTG